METILPSYDVNPETWFYLSLLLIVAVFFRFNRIWSLRNLDLCLLLSLSPGLLFVRERPVVGYAWLFLVTSLLLLRLFCDGLFQRRPLSEQNLNAPGLAFLCLSTFAFLMTLVVTKPPPASTVETVRRADQLLNRKDASSEQPTVAAGPASSLLTAPAVPISKVVTTGNGTTENDQVSVELVAARIMAILAHMAVIFGLFLVGKQHFGETQVGLAMATLYLLLPCTSYDVGKVNHVLPAALIVWAFVAYRRPMIAGCLMGLACGTLFFPIFLLPLWATFYDRRGALRFGAALGIVAAVLLGSLALTSIDSQSFTRQILGSIDWSVLKFQGGAEVGFWSTYNSAFRIPVFVTFLLLLLLLTIWPRKKNLEHLMAHSTVIVVATQFWYPHQGGVYLLWYLPMLLMVVFRPRLTQLIPPNLQESRQMAKSEKPSSHRELASSAVARQLFR